MPESNILDINSQYSTDSKITKIEYQSFIPYTNSFNNNDEIRIPVQQTDTYPYLHDSFIYIEGKISDAGKMLLNNNGIAFLFEQIRLEINGVEIDRTRSLGITSTLKGYLSCTPDEYNYYENAGWTFMNNSNIVDTSTGDFSACVPLKYWLGFFEDFKKILINCRLELILTRSNTDRYNLKDVTKVPEKGSISINKIVWKIPHITVDDGERLKLLQYVEKEKSLFIPFRSFETYEYPDLGDVKKVMWSIKTASKLEKPRYIILGLQKGRNKNDTDSSMFDHSKLTNAKVYLNSVIYPYNNLILDFNKNSYSILYNMYASFQESYYENGKRNPILSPTNFLKYAPIVVIDTSKQNDSDTSSSVDVRLEFEAEDNLKGVTAFCVIIHDRIIEYIP